MGKGGGWIGSLSLVQRGGGGGEGVLSPALKGKFGRMCWIGQHNTPMSVTPYLISHLLYTPCAFETENLESMEKFLKKVWIFIKYTAQWICKLLKI